MSEVQSAVTTFCWVLTAFAGPQTDPRALARFYHKVRPFGPGWKKVQVEAGEPADAATQPKENIPLALLGWSAGCAMIWSALFTVGNALYGRWALAAVLASVFVTSTSVLLFVIKRLWK